MGCRCPRSPQSVISNPAADCARAARDALLRFARQLSVRPPRDCHELVPDTLKDLLGLVVEGKGQGVGEHNTGLPVDVVCHNSPPHMCYKAVNTVTFSFKDGPRSNHDAEGGANGGK